MSKDKQSAAQLIADDCISQDHDRAIAMRRFASSRERILLNLLPLGIIKNPAAK